MFSPFRLWELRTLLKCALGRCDQIASKKRYAAIGTLPAAPRYEHFHPNQPNPACPSALLTQLTRRSRGSRWVRSRASLLRWSIAEPTGKSAPRRARPWRHSLFPALRRLCYTSNTAAMRVFLYDEGTCPTLRAEEVAAFLSHRLPAAQVTLRGEFVTRHAGESCTALAEQFAAARVRNPAVHQTASEPLHGEVEFERRRLANSNRGPHGVLYDGLSVQWILRQLLDRREATRTSLHIVFTSRLAATWEDDDLRYHLRAVVLGSPALISTSGLVEAPAKPREFYFALQVLGSVASDDARYLALKREFGDRFLDHDDPRLTDVAKGYILQAAAYQFAGQGFCPDPACQLFNAHWQEEMLAAQLPQKLCPTHQQLFESLG